jgi:hypothetical protein
MRQINPNSLANRSGKVSKTRLEAWCKEHNYPLPEYEAFGRKVCAFFWKAPNGWSRKRWEDELRSVGCKVNTDWCSESEGTCYGKCYGKFTGTEVENISYFKAWHWDE